MNISIIKQSLKNLSVKRPFFWSEADFQFAFSEELRILLPNAKIRLERPFPINATTTYHVDIWVEDEGKIYPIELKYKTKKCSATIAGETFNVTDHSAIDLGRYDYVADIKRIEEIKNHNSSSFGEGYAIILTNDLRYSTNPGKQVQTMDADFRIHNGTILSGIRRWKKTPTSTLVNANGNRKSRVVINLAGQYTMNWDSYSQFNDIEGHMVNIEQCVSIIK